MSLYLYSFVHSVTSRAAQVHMLFPELEWTQANPSGRQTNVFSQQQE